MNRATWYGCRRPLRPKIEYGLTAARDSGLPVVLVLSSAGADIIEGMPALDAWGRVAAALASCSGRVPTIAVVDGPAVSGPALLLGLADFTIMTESSYAFVNGPVMVEEFTGVGIDVDELGGAAELARYTGVATMVVADREAAVEAVGEPAGVSPRQRRRGAGPLAVRRPGRPAVPRGGRPDPGDVDRQLRRPQGRRGDRRRRQRCSSCAIAGRRTSSPRSPPSTDGRSASWPTSRSSLAGTLDIPASQKAARFVAFCDAFNLPIITLVDTPGFYPGKDLEWRGMIRHGAQLVFAYARATVPRICVILRKSYGGAFIVMDSKTMGNDLCLAWPGAELAVMGAGQAAAILQRRATPEERAEFEADYAERLLNPYVAAERGYVDAVIDPADTRREIAAALDMLDDKREVLSPRKHGNSPL